MDINEFNDCVDLCADPLYRFMLKGIRDGQKAQDLVQDAFEKLWVGHARVDAAKAKSYLFKIAYNAMIDMIRHDKHTIPVEGSGLVHSAHSQHYSDLNEALHRAVEQLPAVQRSVVLLRDYEGYSHEEIGEITGLNASQVKVYIYRARVFLRDYIGSMEQVI
ncbi:MAG: RNA polymerase sigma factor [Rikenellaceae bacterium]|jgi:RNA polymerase sigma-70 factor (ECF subfamily)|nr:RNA polymerase sigma factor [Rikenellaceae bacterium]